MKNEKNEARFFPTILAIGLLVITFYYDVAFLLWFFAAYGAFAFMNDTYQGGNP